VLHPDITVVPTSELSCSLGAFPAASVNGLVHNDSPSTISDTRLRSIVSDTVTPDDFLLTSNGAESHFKYFQTKLDPLIHHILTSDDSLNSVRARSPFLAISLCTTAAYCTGAGDYQKWLTRFKALVAEKTFTSQHAFDDVRALCVGALWLNEIATALNALCGSCFICFKDQY